MKKFLTALLLFFLPLVLLVIGIECYVLYYPNTFNRKAAYLKSNAAQIETLILGSSHNQNAINPEYLHRPAINLANAGQDVQLDSAVFFKSVQDLPRLNTVILEFDYLTMEEKNDADYFKLPWYNRFYDVKLGSVSLLHRLSVYSSSPAYFNKLIIDEINPKRFKYNLNKAGFIINDFPGIMEELKYDSLALARTSNERLKDKHTRESIKDFRFNKAKFDAIVKYCGSRNIRVIIISTPMYSTYLNHEIPAKNHRREDYINQLQQLPFVTYFDFEKDSRFGVHDFKNDDHLNSNGAKKFSLLIDSIVMAPTS